MLINKGFSNGDVISLKLVNGDELITRFEEETSDTITINRPLALTFGGQGLGMMPWMFLGDKDVYVLSKNHVFAMSISKKDAADQYLQGTTGIALK
jgi:hypothetical protein